MRLMIARCSITYSGRLNTHLATATRLLMFKADGTFMVWSDHGGSSVKPLNWMTPPTVVEESPERIVVRKRAGAGEEQLEVAISEVLSDVTHEMGSPEADVALTKDGVEAHLQELLAEQPHWCGDGFRLVRREWRPISARWTSCAVTPQRGGWPWRSSGSPGSRRWSS
jgi:RecB family endonuclease NucS